eukprot:3253687-Prymnesium_polylepis.1
MGGCGCSHMIASFFSPFSSSSKARRLPPAAFASCRAAFCTSFRIGRRESIVRHGKSSSDWWRKAVGE